MATLRCTEAEGWDGIADALSRAMPGDEVIIGAGEYRGSHTLFVKSGVHLLGEDNACLNCASGLRPITLRESHGARVSNLNIILGDNSPPPEAGYVLDDEAIYIRGSNDVVIDGCILDGNGFDGNGIHIGSSQRARISGCRISNFGRGGIMLLSSQCIAENNECLKNNSEGIYAGRYYIPDHGPSELTATNNRCNHNGVGIFLISSVGVLESNECWGNGHGISIQHDSSWPDTLSILTAVNNRCHDNSDYGIVLHSSLGLLEHNECWGNLSGIGAQRDSDSPEAPFKLSAKNNRCHDNSRDGITLYSSVGVLDGNECSGNSIGIAAHRYPESYLPECPSELTATNNRCHDNSSAGIVLFSSTGVLEGNECWGNPIGIAAQLDYSHNAPSVLTASDNNCHDNRGSGIALFSSTGVLDGNECRGNSTGIAAQRDPDSPEYPSDLTATNNRCHDNRSAGIVLFSSTGVLEGNECHRSSTGIAARRDSNFPQAPSELTATNNCCHDNNMAGIALLSSTGVLENNECWVNAYGIAAQRDPLSPDAPSELTTTNNHCHDNRGSGIALFSSTGVLEGNECWGNTNGIAAQRDTDHPEAPSKLTATDNRCHDNSGSGIVLFSSTGMLEGNECCDNLIGITAEPDTNLPGLIPSELIATNNCCDDNRSGILLASSLGILKDNKCRNNVEGISATLSELTVTSNHCHNRETNIELTDSDSVGNLWDNESVGIPSGMHAPMFIYKDKNNGKPFPHPGHWRNLRHENGKTCINLLPPSAPEIEAGQNTTPSLDALSGLIRTGGCPHCFHRFWLGDEGDAFPSFLAPASLTPPDDSSERIYSVKRRNDKQDEPIEIRRLPPETNCNSSQRAQEGSALSRILGCIDDMSTPPTSVYSVAWVSADTAQLDAEFARFAEARVKFRNPIHNLDFSSRPSGDEAFKLWLDGQWLANRRRGLEYWKAMGMIPVGELMPGWKSMIFMLTFLLLTVLWVVANAWPSDYQGSLPPMNITEATALLNQSVSIFAQEWSKLSLPWKVVGGFVLFFVLFVFLNRHQPPALRIAPEKFAWAAELVEFPGVKFLLNWLLGHPSEISRKRWLRTQLFGYKLFGLFKFQPDSVIFVFRGVDALSQIEQEELLELARLRHEGQVALLITEMTDLSMLLNTWLDVWLPDNRDGLAKDDSAYVIHNPKYLNIPKSPDIFSDLAIATNDTLAARSDMAKMFRLESIPQGESTTREDEGYLNDLVDDVWGFSDLLPMLIVGSNHYAPMSMEKLVSNDPDKIKARLLEMLRPYAKLLKLENNEFPLGAVKPTEAIAKKAEAIYKRHRPGEASTSWLGCQEYRQRLGNALRDWFLFKKHSHEPARLYLAAQMACGELFHINQAIHSSDKWSKNELKEDGQQRLALHCEAGLFLMRERMSIELLPTILASTRYEPQELRNSWGALTQSIHQELNESPPEVCATRISIVCLQAETAFGDTVIQPLLAELADLINNPFIRSQNDKSIWNAFLSSVRNTLLRLSGVSGGEAQTLLEKRFRQDWGELPETLKNKLRESLKGSYDALIFQAMSEMADEQSLETLCRQLTHRPAFLIANLLVLAIPGALAENVPEVEIASILRTIRKNVPDNQDMEKGARFIGIPCGVKKEVNQAAWRVLNTIHKESWKWKSTKMPDMSNEIEGLALGKHGAVAGSLDQLVELELRAG